MMTKKDVSPYDWLDLEKFCQPQQTTVDSSSMIPPVVYHELLTSRPVSLQAPNDVQDNHLTHGEHLPDLLKGGIARRQL